MCPPMSANEKMTTRWYRGRFIPRPGYENILKSALLSNGFVMWWAAGRP